jgi:hypothetical protein
MAAAPWRWTRDSINSAGLGLTEFQLACAWRDALGESLKPPPAHKAGLAEDPAIAEKYLDGASDSLKGLAPIEI